MAKRCILTLCENICFPAQDGLRHLQKHHKHLHVGVLKLGPSRFSKNYVIDKLNKSFTSCRHLVLAGKVSFTGIKFSLFAHPHNETEIQNNLNWYIYWYLFARISFILFCVPYMKNTYQCLNKNSNFLKSIWNGLKTFHCLMFTKNVNFEFWFPLSLEHNYDNVLSKIKSKNSSEIRIVLTFRKCPTFWF